MSTVSRTAGVAGTFPYTMSQAPIAVPKLTIYSNALRTVVAVAEADTVATGNPAVFTAAYPATLAVGTYYLSFRFQLTVGQPFIIDQDDILELVSVSGLVSGGYASVQDGRDFGITTTEAADTALSDMLELASRIIDNYTGRDFAASAQATVTVHDVRGPIVTLPTPFSTITAVEVDDVALTSASYQIETWGLRIYGARYDADGWPQATSVLARGRHPYGAKVEVTATFGYASVPSAVRQATVLLAAHMIRDKDTLTAGGVSQLSVEGYSVSFGASQLATSGVPEADRLLLPYSRVQVA